MKIVFTVHSYYPNKNGVQVVTEYLAEELAKKGHEINVITTLAEGYANKDIHNGVKIERVDARVIHTFNKGEKKKFQRNLLKVCDGADVLINVCTQTALTDWSFLLLNKISCKKILYLHGIVDLKFHKSDFYSVKSLSHKIWNVFRYKIYYKKNGKYFRIYDNIVQLHRFDRGYTFFQDKYNIKSIVIENAAEDEFFQEIEFTFQKKYILSVANYLPVKNQELLLTAFYKSNLPQSTSLILIGNKKTPYYENLIQLKQKLDKQYGIHCVEFLTNISRNDIYRYTKCAKVCLLGSTSEMFPISIVEAMAAGVPFISTNVGCVKYLPGGVVIENVEEMVYWLEMFWNNENIRELYGKAGKEYARKHFMIKNKVDQLENIIKGEK